MVYRTPSKKKKKKRPEPQEITLKRLHRTQLDYLESSKTPSQTYINKTVLVEDLITFHKQSGEFSQARQAVVFNVGLLGLRLLRINLLVV